MLTGAERIHKCQVRGCRAQVKQKQYAWIGIDGVVHYCWSHQWCSTHRRAYEIRKRKADGEPVRCCGLCGEEVGEGYRQICRACRRGWRCMSCGKGDFEKNYDSMGLCCACDRRWHRYVKRCGDNEPRPVLLEKFLSIKTKSKGR